jgi:hypothetical protein
METHLPIIQALESPTPRCLICVPRGTFKSSIVSVAYPIWRLNRNPNLRLFLDSELYSNSVNFLREIQGHYLSEKFIEIFGDLRSETWNQSELIVSTRTKVLKEPSILAGGIGTTKVGQHYDEIIGDDYNSPRNSSTHEGRKKVIDHYQYNTSVLELHGRYTIVGTRYAEDDLIGFILKNEIGLENQADVFKMKKTNGVIYA